MKPRWQENISNYKNILFFVASYKQNVARGWTANRSGEQQKNLTQELHLTWLANMADRNTFGRMELGEDNILSIVRNNDSSLHASIKSFISVSWLYLISFLISKADKYLCAERRGRRGWIQVIVSLFFRENQKKETSSKRLDLVVSKSIINTCPNVRSAYIFISLPSM